METGHAARIDPSLIIERLRAWVTGAGLFSLHAGIYLLIAFALFIWNLIENPTDLGVPVPRLIIPWGVLVLIHAAVVAVIAVLHDAFAPESDQPAALPPAEKRTPVAAPSTASVASDTKPPGGVSRFRPAATSLDDVRGGDQTGQQAAWKRPVQSLRQAAATLRHEEAGTGSDQAGWRAESIQPLSEAEQRAVGDQQLARWRGGRTPATNGQNRASAHSAPDGRETSAVVRPLAADHAEFDETEWRWLEAAATSHLAQREPGNGTDGSRLPRTEPFNAGTEAGEGTETGANSSS